MARRDRHILSRSGARRGSRLSCAATVFVLLLFPPTIGVGIWFGMYISAIETSTAVTNTSESPDSTPTATTTEELITVDLSDDEPANVTTPSHPGNYPNNLDLRWVFRAAPGRRVLLAFRAFDTQYNRDFVEVGSGANSTDPSSAVYRRSGHHPTLLPPDLLSPGGGMWLRFTSDASVNKSGFSLSARSVPSADVTDCEGWPSFYFGSQRCDGSLECPNGDDERDCVCSEDAYKCRNTVCVSPADARCNRDAECLDYSDEGPGCNEADCVGIDIDACRAILPYNTTYNPNGFASGRSIADHLTLLTTNCTGSEQLALCAAFFPECPRFGNDRAVCASLCSGALECLGLGADSTELRCDVYPDSGQLSTPEGCLYDGDVLQTGGCGRRPAASPSPSRRFRRIVGGADANIADWPWVGSYRTPYQCGATLLTPYWAVTAAHCGANSQLVLGSSLYDVPPDYPHAYRVEQLFVHPRYNKPWRHNDIALIKLAAPVRFADTVQPACLETGEDEVDKYRSCHVVGWGTTEHQGDTSDVLQEARLPLVPWEQCKTHNALLKAGAFVSSDQICAGDGTNDTCQGDSGGPLICRGGDGRWRLVGVTSVGHKCGGGTPGVYTRISKYIDFIRFTIAAGCLSKSSSCLSNGTCQSGSSGFACECPFGFVGPRCQTELNIINITAGEPINITSPDYPGNYPNNLDRHWVILAAPGLRVRLGFVVFETEECCDYLRAGDGYDFTDASTRTATWSGAEVPADHVSGGHVLWLRLQSDGSVNGAGFALVVSVQSNE